MKTQVIIANHEMVNEARTMLMLATDPSQVELVLITRAAPSGAKDFTRLVTQAPSADLPNFKETFNRNYIFLCSPEASYYETSVRETLGKMFDAHGNISVSKANSRYREALMRA